MPASDSKRRAVIPELAVVIVLENPGIGVLRPIEQFQPARHRHLDAQRKLMRRRHIGGARANGAAARPLATRKPNSIDRHGDRTAAAMLDRLAGRGIAGILAPDLVVAP